MVLCFLALGSGGRTLPDPGILPRLPDTQLEMIPLKTASASGSTSTPGASPGITTREAEIRTLFTAKRYDDALKLIAEEMQKLDRAKAGDVGYREWLDRQTWILKTAQAWVFLEKQNCSGAMAIIGEIPSDKVPVQALKGIGYCKLMAREWQEADSALSRYLQSQNRDHEAVQLLARAKESQGLYEEAIDLTNSLASMPTAIEEKINLEPMKKSLLAKQDETTRQLLLESGYIKVHYQPNLSLEFVEKVVETMNRTAAKLNMDFGIDYPSTTIDIFFHSVERFGTITHGPDWAAGIYDGQIRLPIGEEGLWSEAVERSIRHEFAHALLAEMVARRSLPTWFQEGFAQLAECEGLCQNFEFAATTQTFFSAEKLEESFMNMKTREAQVAYKQSLYMMISLLRWQNPANVRQMFSLMSGLDTLSSKDIIEQSSGTYADLHQFAASQWNSQKSL